MLILPLPSIETFTLKDRGALVLRGDQVRARALTLTVEKVISPPPSRSEYFNLRYPEPKGFWGYLQVVARDFVVSTVPLEYRRQVVLQWDRVESQQLAQVRCDVLELGEFLANYIQVSGSDNPVELAALELMKQQYASERQEQTLLPVAFPTALWYDIEPGCVAQITTEWVEFVIPCSASPIDLPALRPPEKGESGGQNRPDKPVPQDRAGDPLADSEKPPIGAPVSPGAAPPGPPPPPPPVAQVLVKVRTTGILSGSGGGCNNLVTNVDEKLFTNVSPDPDLFSVRFVDEGPYGPCSNIRLGYYEVRYNGVSPGQRIGPAGFDSASTSVVISAQSV